METSVNSIHKQNNIVNFQIKKEQFNVKFHTEVAYLIDEILDSKQQTVAWMLYYSMKDHYPIDAVCFTLELWHNYCDEIDPIIDDEGKYAASMELFVSKLLNLSARTKYEILYKYDLHKKYDPISIEI